LDTSRLPLLTGLTSRLKHLSGEQRVVSENIANSDSPGFKAQEVKAQDFSRLLAKVQASAGAATGKPMVSGPAIAFPTEMSRLGSRRARDVSTREAAVVETKPNGNTVVLEDQLMRMAEVQMEYSTLTNLYRKQIGLLRTALGRNR
jgi:flagellar basal-body rod protein FlgB